MMASVQQQEAFTAILSARWEQASRKVAELAEVIPADEFDSRPLAGVRNVGEFLRHVAFWNQYVADTLNGRQADDAANELPLAAYPTKASILEALKRSSADVAAALREHQASLDSKTVEIMMSFVEHTSEHYGQLVVYARLMGTVPPASRT
jgi:uncharacterized damage-inducible protein DinB